MSTISNERGSDKTRTVFLLLAVVFAFFIGAIVRRWIWH